MPMFLFKRLELVSLALLLAIGLVAAPGTARADCSPTSTNGILGGLGGAVVGGLLGSTIGGGSGKTLATIGGALAGGLVGNNLATQLTCQDQNYLGNSTYRSLDSGQPVSWKNPDSGNYGDVTPVRSYNSQQGQYCREFQQTIYVDGKREQGYGTACRQPDGSWKIVS
ncbi:RT0821/Lpp0805 family surface protein [Parvibaculum sp.]|uniref:RT0821/Lpp0805 family surface protein n=1 Tax=Parvibaculum sp. TaxID=2024848 RepID=UPI002B6C9D5D|nr:RT0821/Lpp0805 family surface protein [Parvibaculum sp.]HUD50984.1 RT0821/Lpp0805 family surface protein [Parvibaculum sp.]